MLMFSFIMFVLCDELDDPFGYSGSPPFSVYIIVFTLFSRQIKYDDDDDRRVFQRSWLAVTSINVTDLRRQVNSTRGQSNLTKSASRGAFPGYGSP